MLAGKQEIRASSLPLPNTKVLVKPEKTVIMGKGWWGCVLLFCVLEKLAYLGRKSKQLHFIEQLHYRRIQPVLSEIPIYL